MGVLSSQLTTNFSAKNQLTTIFLANSQLTTILVTYQLSLSYSAYYSVTTQISFTSARQSILGVGPTKFRFKLT